jgi:chromate transporter
MSDCQPPDDALPAAPPPWRRVGDPGTPLLRLARPFLKLGFLGFGGPAAHIAMMEEDIVERRRWLSHQSFLDLVGATHLIPGPNSTETCMHIGYLRRGWPGMVLAWSCFVLPASLMVLALAWAYVRFGSLPQVEPFLRGIKPAVLAVIVGAVWRLGQRAVKGWRLGALGVATLGATVLGAHPIAALLAGGVVGMVWLRWAARGRGGSAGGAGLTAALTMGITRRAGAAGLAAAGAATGAAAAVSLWALALVFLKVGAILYGTGYVLVAFLEADLVAHYGWLTREQLLDAIAVGQLTPGPLLTTSTFVGYVVARSAGLSGLAGAALCTVAFCLPSFVFVIVLNRVIPRLRESVWTAAFLDAVNVSAVGLMAAVCVNLGRQTLISLPAWGIAVGAALLALRWRVSAAWLVIGGAVVGWLMGM